MYVYITALRVQPDYKRAPVLVDFLLDLNRYLPIR